MLQAMARGWSDWSDFQGRRHGRYGGREVFGQGPRWTHGPLASAGLPDKRDSLQRSFWCPGDLPGGGGCSLGGSGHLGGPSQWEVLLTGVSAQLEGL